MREITFKNNNVYIKCDNFNLDMTFDCGQAFRFKKISDNLWQTVAYGKKLVIEDADGFIVLRDVTENEFYSLWENYFDLKRDYNEIIKVLSADKTLKIAAKYGKGIRILNQEPFETLCSFIISQNNNIPRIKGIIDRLCKKYGEYLGEDLYAFPTASVLANLNEEDLKDIRMGFRARYIIDAAKKVSQGEVDLNKLKFLDYKTAQNKLMTILGVGPKVADCTLLFSLNHFEAFPKDVWIKRAMEVLFPNGLPDCVKGYEGIAQQYIFYYAINKKI